MLECYSELQSFLSGAPLYTYFRFICLRYAFYIFHPHTL